LSAPLVDTVVVIAFAMAFAWTNGFHDAANAIATSVSTRALTPRIALGMAAVGNLIGSFLGGRVAATVGHGLVALPSGRASLGVVLAALLGAILWNLATWWFGIPSSSSHALVGGLIGATLVAAGGAVFWGEIMVAVIIPLLAAPLVGFTLGLAAMVAVLWAFRTRHPARLNRGFRRAQVVSAFAMAMGHGIQDAAKTVGVIGLALTVGGHLAATAEIPIWVYVATAVALAAGTYTGAWRIIKTLGRRVIHLEPPHGFAAETSASTVLFVSAGLGLPVSTTQTITSAIVGVGSTRRLSAVRWGVAGNIVAAWLLTLPAAAAVAMACYLMIRPIF
jgi:PiT family inorganic phosphate transporter